jgi:hypothetical protein
VTIEFVSDLNECSVSKRNTILDIHLVHKGAFFNIRYFDQMKADARAWGLTNDDCAMSQHRSGRRSFGSDSK